MYTCIKHVQITLYKHMYVFDKGDVGIVYTEYMEWPC